MSLDVARFDSFIRGSIEKTSGNSCMRDDRPRRATFDVLGIGNAVVDVLSTVGTDVIDELGLERGAMTLVDEARSEALYARMTSAREVSGGSCANTIAALANMGGRGAYIGKVRNDRLGLVFAEDVRSSGVDFRTPPSVSGPLTARSMIFVTPDGQRTMQTYLGACVELAPDDVDDELVRESSVTYLEGYLWDRPLAKDACVKAIKLAHAAERKVALTLSDSFCVDRWRDEFVDLIGQSVDILFANQGELQSLYPGVGFEEALEQVERHTEIVALTRGAEGSIVAADRHRHMIAADLRGQLVDTTGAGDLYAAGFLRGWCAGFDLPQCGRLGSAAAGQIITQYGARAEISLEPLYTEVAQSDH